MKNKDKEMMKLALQAALLSKTDVPIGCVITTENGIIAQAHNQREEANNPVGHAEILAIQEAAKRLGSWRLEGTTLYCTLEPCPMCAEAIIQSRISYLVFGAYDTVAGAAGSKFNLFVNRQALPIPEVVGGIMEEECRQLLQLFFITKRQ